MGKNHVRPRMLNDSVVALHVNKGLLNERRLNRFDTGV